MSYIKYPEHKHLILTLGNLIDIFEKIDLQYEYDGEFYDKHVSFDFCRLYPTRFDSFRGIYSQLALGYDFEERMPAKKFLQNLKFADGNVFEGWKGGEFKMDRNTPVWVANQGESSDTAIIDVFEDTVEIILHTGYFSRNNLKSAL